MTERPTQTEDGDRDESLTATWRRRFLQAVGGAAVASGGVGAASADEGDGEGETVSTVALTHGVASGDVTARTAVVWARTADEATLHVQYAPATDEDTTTKNRGKSAEHGNGEENGWGDENKSNGRGNASKGATAGRTFGPVRLETAEVTGDTDYTGQVRLTGLRPGTRYHYQVWATAGGRSQTVPDSAATGTFVTAPAADEGQSVSFAWSGDTWGYGDDPVDPPFEGLKTIAERNPDFFLFLGDTIYADAQTPAGKITGETPLDEALDVYRGKYKEMRDPPSSVAETTHLRELLQTTSVYAMWDDHEVINNFAGSTSALMPDGRQAFFEYWPIDESARVTGGEEGRLYRSFRWGEHCELFVLDTRQYRDPNVDLEQKALLGAKQREWLKKSLSQSDATWKVIATPAPMGASTDTWSTTDERTGYEDVLLDVVKHIEREGISNVVTVAGDVHYSQVGAYDTDDDGDFEFYEAIAGPLGAYAGTPGELYPPMHPTEFFGKGDYFNFGTVDVSADGETLTLGIYAEDGTEQFTKEIEASEATPTEPPERIESTFDEGTDGWLVAQNGGSAQPDHHPDGGQSGGCIGDSEAQGGIAWYYQAPFEFLGDRSEFYGGTLSFDLRQEATDSQFDAEAVAGGDVALTSGDVTLVYDARGENPNPDTGWTHYEIPLSPDAPWVNLEAQEPLATEEDIRAVLSDLEQLRIRGEYRSGDDASYLDNVVLSRE